MKTPKNSALKEAFNSILTEFEDEYRNYVSLDEQWSAAIKANDDELSDKICLKYSDAEDKTQQLVINFHSDIEAALQQHLKMIKQFCNQYRHEGSAYISLNSELLDYKFELISEVMMSITEEFDI